LSTFYIEKSTFLQDRLGTNSKTNRFLAGDLGSPGVWTDDQVWALYFNVSSDQERTDAVWKYLESTPRDGLAVEDVPCRWSNIRSENADIFCDTILY
jgi:hypothetical protein